LQKSQAKQLVEEAERLAGYATLEVVLFDSKSHTLLKERVDEGLLTIKLIRGSQGAPGVDLNLLVTDMKGDYFLVLDKGMMMPEGFLLHSLERMSQLEGVGFTYAALEVHDQHGSYLQEPGFQNMARFMDMKHDIAGMVRKNAWEFTDGFDESLRGFKMTGLLLQILTQRHYTGHKVSGVYFKLQSGAAAGKVCDVLANKKLVISRNLDYFIRSGIEVSNHLQRLSKMLSGTKGSENIDPAVKVARERENTLWSCIRKHLIHLLGKVRRP
jgi:hypothetical protein